MARRPRLAASQSDGRATTLLGVYFGRMRGKPRSFVRPRASAVVVTLFATFISIFVISIPTIGGNAPLSAKLFLIGSFGASAALLYAAPQAEFAQPRNIVFGQLIAAFMGVAAYKLLGGNVGVAAGIAVAAATIVMQVTGCLHPPAGATALIAVLGPAKVPPPWLPFHGYTSAGCDPDHPCGGSGAAQPDSGRESALPRIVVVKHAGSSVPEMPLNSSR